MPIFILLEGPDGSGKSTLAAQLTEHYCLPLYHGGPPPPGNHLAYILEVISDYAQTGVVFDRLAFAESVYGPILRGYSRLTRFQQRVINSTLSQHAAIKILCLPPFEVCYQAWYRRPGELFTSKVQLSQIWQGHAEAKASFDIVYDWTKDGSVKLLDELDRRLLV